MIYNKEVKLMLVPPKFHTRNSIEPQKSKFGFMLPENNLSCQSKVFPFKEQITLKPQPNLKKYAIISKRSSKTRTNFLHNIAKKKKNAEETKKKLIKYFITERTNDEL